MGKFKVVAKRVGYLAKAMALASVLGVIEIVTSQRARRVLGAVVLAAVAAGGGYVGWRELHTTPVHDQVYRPDGDAKQFQSSDGLSLGIDVTVRWAPASGRADVDELADVVVQPAVDGVLHRIYASHTVKEIFASQRADIQKAAEQELREALAADGVTVKSFAMGSVELPEKYREGMEETLAAELAVGRQGYELDMKKKEAEAAGAESIIAAKAQAEAMQHVLPLKQQEIEEKRLEAAAARAARVEQAKGEADARRLEAGGEADARRVLADSDAYRLDVTGKATAAQMEREGDLIAKNPLLIQKAVADKLSDKISVAVVSPGVAGGFFNSPNGMFGGASYGSGSGK
jgi:regulator of protease activity HflC (stomatin/prohibitin superfamily)